MLASSIIAYCCNSQRYVSALMEISASGNEYKRYFKFLFHSFFFFLKVLLFFFYYFVQELVQDVSTTQCSSLEPK